MRRLPRIFDWFVAVAMLLMLTIIVSPRFTKAGDMSLRLGLKQQLSQLQTQIDAYAQEHNGEYPDLGTSASNGWDALLVGGYLSNPPLNLHVNKALVLASATTPELLTADHHINQTDVGWFFNPTTGRIIANGYDHTSNTFHDEQGYDLKAFSW